MGLSGRKEKILSAVVKSYIDSCQPVSSLEIHSNFFPEVSSATIRNELNALEEMGYLAQPHISSGRVPTAEGYRLYVQKLLPKKKLTKNELNTIKQYLGKKVRDVEDIVRNTAKVISQITNLTAVGYVKSQKNDVIQSVKIVPLSSGLALFVIVTDHAVLKDAVVMVNDGLSEGYFNDAGVFLSEVFRGRTIGEVNRVEKITKQIKREYERLYHELLKLLKTSGEQALEPSIAVEGTSKILEQPEYSNLTKARAMLKLLEAKDELYPLLHEGGMEINIRIGGDDEIKDGLPECAIITTSYTAGGVEIANAGVIGPIRMDYGKVISVLDYVRKTVTMVNNDDEE